MMWWGDQWGWGAWLAMAVSMLGFWALVIWAVTTVVRSTDARGSRDAEGILAERFARGEIDDEEYEHRRDLLRARHRAQGIRGDPPASPFAATGTKSHEDVADPQ